jgi:hypothetical protein
MTWRDPPRGGLSFAFAPQHRRAKNSRNDRLAVARNLIPAASLTAVIPKAMKKAAPIQPNK